MFFFLGCIVFEFFRKNSNFGNFKKRFTGRNYEGRKLRFFLAFGSLQVPSQFVVYFSNIKVIHFRKN